MYTISEVAKMLKMTDKGIRIRCSRLQIKSKIRPLIISEKNFIRIKNYKFLQVFRSSFYFSKDGKYLIINSRLNKETL
jgi:hypothetical protein